MRRMHTGAQTVFGDAVITWHVHADEVRIYRDGVIVAHIAKAQWGNLIYELAAVMRRA